MIMYKIHSVMRMKAYDVIIIGLGPAGCTAAIYATRYGLRTLAIGKDPGGQTNEAWEIENYPGVPKISGFELMKKFMEQAKSLGAELLFEEAEDISGHSGAFRVKTSSGAYEGKSIILATGARKRKLGIPGEKELLGRGVSYCSTCDGPLFRGKTVVVVGGGDSAVCAGVALSEHARKAYIVYRKDKRDMRVATYCLKRAEGRKNMEMVFNAIPVSINGKDMVESATFKKHGKDFDIKADGVFVEIGTEPETFLAKKLGVSLSERGKIVVSGDMSTNVRGVFAAGDVTNGSEDFEQIITAAAEGGMAARSAYKYLRKG